VSVCLNDLQSLQSGSTPLDQACSKGHVEVVAVLMTAGAQANAQNLVRRVEIRVDLSSSGWLHSPPSCLLSRSCGGGVCPLIC
jgi:ankyrin repeat protein